MHEWGKTVGVCWLIIVVISEIDARRFCRKIRAEIARLEALYRPLR